MSRKSPKSTASRSRPKPRRQAGGSRPTPRRSARKADGDLSVRVRAVREAGGGGEYADLFDFAPVTYALLDSLGVVIKANLAACLLLNVERRHLVRHPLLSFVVPQDRRELLDHLRRCRAGHDVVESEIRFASSGRLVTCRLYSRLATYANANVFPTVIVDQTEQRTLDQARLEAERRRAEAERATEVANAASVAKDRFLATVSHELRTPLTPALFAASRLASWEGLPEQASKLATTIKRNIEVEARLIDDLLDVARINRNRISLRLDTVDVHEVLQEAVAICNAVAETRDVTIGLHLVASVHHVRGDRARLRQVFWNLLNNAVKFAEAGGRVNINSANGSAPSTVTVTVRDNGAGMDASVLERLFVPFDRESMGQESRGGLGLGLAICKGIVAAHGGQISAASEGPGWGSTFAVDLTTVAEQRSSAPEPDRPATGAPRGNASPMPVRVLVIEDDPDSSEMLALFLSQHGYEVEVASSVTVGINRLEERWDVILSDIGLPDGSGLEVARRATRMPRPPERLIAFTGYGSTDDIRASQEAGFDDHVVKPIDLEKLLETLSRVLESRRQSG